MATFPNAPRRAGLAACAVLAAAASPGAGAADDGAAVFDVHCIACHGPDARGIDGAGVDLVGSAFVARTGAAELVAFLKEGRLPDDPASITGRPMPGFYWVPEADLRAVAAYVKSRKVKD